MKCSSIDRLPAWADSAKQWAFVARLRAAAQAAGVAEVPQVSGPAFDRWAERIAVLCRRLEETREIAAALAQVGDDATGVGARPSVPEITRMLVREVLAEAETPVHIGGV